MRAYAPYRPPEFSSHLSAALCHAAAREAGNDHAGTTVAWRPEDDPDSLATHAVNVHVALAREVDVARETQLVIALHGAAMGALPTAEQRCAVRVTVAVAVEHDTPPAVRRGQPV